MPVNGPRATSPTQRAGPETALAGCREPAWIIDPAQGRVLAANPAGAARLGLRPDAASGMLDASMPGLIRLRALARERPAVAHREPLVFWTAYGAEQLLCDVAAVAGESTAAENPQSLLLVSIARREPHKARETASTSEAKAKGHAGLAAIAPSADDAATLKKIARAIRSGYSGAGGSGDGKTPMADEPAAETESAPQVSKLAHELRTPLSAIAVAAEVMKDQRFGAIGNARYLSYTSDIHDNARHALTLINRLLGVGDDDRSPRTLQPEELDLNALSEGTVSSVRPLAEEAGVNLTAEFHARLPRVTADATAVRQILFNFLSNAIKYTPRGGDVRVVTGLGFDRSVFVAVQDTGSGMTAEAIATAMEATVPDNPQRRQQGGLGIGLPLARSLAEANGARLEIDSAPGDGTAAALIFPRELLAVRSVDA